MAGPSEAVVFNGITFRRWPESSNWADRSYFTPGGSYRKRGVGRLHQEVWKAAHGPIPAGHDIHHLDENPLNNDLANLAALPGAEHHSRHGHGGVVSPQARAAAAEWHGSEAGLAWHVEQGRRSWEGRTGVDRTCAQCGSTFDSVTRRADDRFCSNNCKSAWRRACGVDDEDRACQGCGQTFRVNRYSRTRCCSRKCAWVVRRAVG